MKGKQVTQLDEAINTCTYILIKLIMAFSNGQVKGLFEFVIDRMDVHGDI